MLESLGTGKRPFLLLTFFVSITEVLLGYWMITSDDYSNQKIVAGALSVAVVIAFLVVFCVVFWIMKRYDNNQDPRKQN